MHGKLLGIFIADAQSAPMTSVDSVIAVAEQGLNGDRYGANAGTFSKNSKKARHITLIEIEAIWALKRDYDIDIAPKDLRRNLLTEHIALNHFVGKRLMVGPVIVEGIELCEPCGYLENMVKKPVKDALKHRGGLRCAIISGGLLEVGQPISPWHGEVTQV